MMICNLSFAPISKEEEEEKYEKTESAFRYGLTRANGQLNGGA
jgi:hypothetical protein